MWGKGIRSPQRKRPREEDKKNTHTHSEEVMLGFPGPVCLILYNILKYILTVLFFYTLTAASS